MKEKRVIVTGGCGFIGANLVRLLVEQGFQVLNFDKLTYAGNLNSLADLQDNPAHRLLVGDICEPEDLERAFEEFRPNGVLHLAAESHVDRSIDGPRLFVDTNVIGTYCVLQAALDYWRKLPDAPKSRFRLLHVSTDVRGLTHSEVQND